MTADLFTGLSGRTDDAATLDEREADYTPPAVALQLLLALNQWRNDRHVWCPRRCLDPSAGSGVWGRAMRAVFGEGPEIIGVEPRVDEAANLRAAYDVDFIGEFEAWAAMPTGGRSYDIIATNPAFTPAFAGRRPDGSPCTPWPLLVLERGLLAPGGTLALYGLSGWGQSAEAAPLLRRWCPSLQLRLSGRPAHRADGQTDQRDYSLWVWREDAWPQPIPEGYHPRWLTVQLPTLPPGLRRWSPSAVPGTYSIDAALVETVRGYL